LDLKQIKQIIDLMKRSELTEFAVEEEGFKLKIRRGLNGNPVATSNGGPVTPVVESSGNQATAGANPTTASGADKEEPGVGYIKAPMVGTFYSSPSPESPPFVEIDAKVEENSVICIIEAMKIMNEIQAEAKGTVIEVLVENGQPVEYGQRLFKIKQA
jgi:acetyl-CoA carboxylase biotin carboxyl carrier protein